MTDVEHETRVFLRELDTFGQPPPRQKLIDSDYNDGKNAHSRLNNSKEFTQKLDTINLAKQALSELNYNHKSVDLSL
ncbi:unnamed protein product [Anisakis simplex]|uniref:Uncharacterized protein n=1 Tax=Anisakis simplex TaxID=6269 RepID=A0A0M3J0B2_ANISI|nr:unnamed protein product [Anisakis simplex]